MNPLLNFLRSPRGRALTQQALTAAGEHLLEALTKAGTAGRVERAVERHVHHFQVHHDKRQQLRDDTIKDAEVLDVHVGDTYKSPSQPYDPAQDPDAP